MQAQGNNYLSKSVKVPNDRYLYTNNRLGDRTITSQIIDGKRYFSSLDAEIYFGSQNSVYIDELINITWGMEQATLPIFGYNSYTWDDIAIGARHVVGKFTMNFVRSGLLYDILKSVESVNRASFYEHNNGNKNLEVKTGFQREHTAAWDKSFNILIGYGDYKKKGVGTSLTIIKCVQITGYSQILDINGNPIAEEYQFIAKDIRTENMDDIVSDNTILESKKPEVNKKSFTFAPTEINLINITGTHDHTNVKNNYIFKMKYKCNGGTPTKFYLALRNHERDLICNETVEVPENKAWNFEMNRKHSVLISDMVQKQKKVGINAYYMYCDITIEYHIDGIEQQPAYLKCQKVIIK